MKKQIVITDISQKYGGVCIFGYDENFMGVRPIMVQDNKLKEIPKSYVDFYHIVPFTKIEFDFISPRPQPPHTEDWIVNEDFSPNFVGFLSEEEKLKFLEKLTQLTYLSIKNSLWGAPLHWYSGKERRTPYIKAGEGARSIVTVKIKGKLCSIKYCETRGKCEYRIIFLDKKGTKYDLSITDLSFREYCDKLKRQGKDHSLIENQLKEKLNQSEIFLRIGLGRPFDPIRKKEGDKCFLFVTSLYSFPDYKI